MIGYHSTLCIRIHQILLITILLCRIHFSYMSVNALHKISWQDSVWFSDLDDTLITTAQSSLQASEGIKEVFVARFGMIVGKRMQEEFMKIFNTMLGVHRGKEITNEYTSLIKEIENYQKNLPPKYGKPKKWSREIFIAIAAKQLELTVSGELISEAADAYWLRLTQNASIVPGAIELINEIKRHNRPFYLVTGSDVRLQKQENGQFNYDPHYSESFKRERVALLRQRGIHFNLVSIGDPEDKPHKEFFDKAIHMAEKDLGGKINLSNAIMIGDSFAADLQTPKEQLGFGWVILFQDGMRNAEVIDKHQFNTGNLASVIALLD